MSQNGEDNEQCFIPSHWQEMTSDLMQIQQLSTIYINELLPSANQLQKCIKPYKLQPRTCFLEIPLTKLNEVLQQQCMQNEQLYFDNRYVIAIQNPQCRTLQSYLKNHQLIYNKIKTYNHYGFQFNQLTSRFKPISYLVDYHQKDFKVLKTLQYVDNLDKKYQYYSSSSYDIFDSNFQSGNLGLVYKKYQSMQRQYFLLLENDTNTHGYTSWFFFKVKSIGKGKISFHILNLSKSSYLYKIGYKISIFSMNKFIQKGIKWFKGGNNIQTYKTNFQKYSSSTGQTYNCLYFQYQFQQNEDYVYFAMCKPYTYSMLTKSIQTLTNSLQNSSIKLDIIKSILSISCNIIPILILQHHPQHQQIQNIQIQNIKLNKKKKIILFMSRQHPGQVVSSHIIQQLIKIIGNEVDDVMYLIKYYTIVLIPMTNPDGVIHGNSRCNLAGLDLNRQWMKSVLKQVTPQTYHLRRLIWQLHQKIGIQYMIDIHGHSKKMNSFCFCNKYGQKYCSQHLPYILSKIDKKFQFNSCLFSTTIDKKNTVRNQLYQFGMKNCVTLENSYFGYWNQKGTKFYNDDDYQQIAKSLIRALNFILIQQYNIITTMPFTKQQIVNQIKCNREIYAKRTNKNPTNITDIQSQSDPQCDIMNPQQMLKIYQSKQKIYNKSINPIQQKKASKLKKSKQKRIKSVISQIKNEFENQNKGQQLLKKINKNKLLMIYPNHKSQKKLYPTIGKSKNNTLMSQQAIRNSTAKQQQNMLNRTYTDQKQCTTSLRITRTTTKNVKINSVKPTKPSLFQSTFYKNIHYDSYSIKNSNKKNPNRRTQAQQRLILKKNPTFSSNYRKFRIQRLKKLLNQTLSIIKVNNHQMAITTKCSLKDQNQYHHRNQIIRKISQKKLIQKRKKMQITEKRQYKQKIDRQREPIKTKQKQKQQQKKQQNNFNIRNQLIKNKKLCGIKYQIQKYKKYQTLIQNLNKFQQSPQIKISTNSVFYYFPSV